MVLVTPKYVTIAQYLCYKVIYCSNHKMAFLLVLDKVLFFTSL
jgi:hypothetical protein